MKQHLRSIAIIAAFVFTLTFTFFGTMGWIGAGQNCTGTGTGSMKDQFTRICHSDSHFALFLAGNCLLFPVLALIISSREIRPLIRYSVIALFIAYGIWQIIAPDAIWNSAYFKSYIYYPSQSGTFDLNCPTCQIPTAIPTQ